MYYLKVLYIISVWKLFSFLVIWEIRFLNFFKDLKCIYWLIKYVILYYIIFLLVINDIKKIIIDIIGDIKRCYKWFVDCK